jgi:hypothetical protein
MLRSTVPLGGTGELDGLAKYDTNAAKLVVRQDEAGKEVPSNSQGLMD